MVDSFRHRLGIWDDLPQCPDPEAVDTERKAELSDHSTSIRNHSKWRRIEIF